MKFAARDASGARTLSTTTPVAIPRQVAKPSAAPKVGMAESSLRQPVNASSGPSESGAALPIKSEPAGAVLFPRGATIFGTGDGRGRVFIVRDGCVRLFKILPDGRQITLALLGPNTIFTQEELMDGIASGARADALTDATVAMVDTEMLTSIIAGSPQLAAAVVNGMSRRFTELQTLVEHLLVRDSSVRLSTMLVSLAEQFGRPTADGLTAIALPLTHQALANMIGSNRVTVTRKLLELQESGAVRALGRNAIAIDTGRLREYARARRKVSSDLVRA